MDLSSNKDDSGSSESNLCLVDVKFEIAEYVQADKVGIYWELEPKVGELDQASHSLQVLHSLALTLSNSSLRHSVFLITVALRRSVSATLTS